MVCSYSEAGRGHGILPEISKNDGSYQYYDHYATRSTNSGIEATGEL